MKPSPLQEADGAWSMRRLLALACVGNAVYVSWLPGATWTIVAVFLGVSLILIGLTTVQELKALTQYRIADAVNGGSVDDGGDDENAVIGLRG